MDQYIGSAKTHEWSLQMWLVKFVIKGIVLHVCVYHCLNVLFFFVFALLWTVVRRSFSRSVNNLIITLAVSAEERFVQIYSRIISWGKMRNKVFIFIDILLYYWAFEKQVTRLNANLFQNWLKIQKAVGFNK